MPRSAPLALTVALALAGPGCGSDSPHPAPAPRGATPTAHAADPVLDTDLPASMPESLELELRRRTEDGDDTVLKLTPAGARFGLARDKSRVSLRFGLPPQALETAYQTFREASFDRMQTRRQAGGSTAGSSLRITAGPGRYSVAAMGRNSPTDEHMAAYTRCVDAVSSLLPTGRSATVVQVRWDASVGGHAASLDINADPGFVGVHRIPGPHPAIDLHIAQPRTMTVLLRHASPPQSETHEIYAGRDRGVEIAYDDAQARVVVRPLPQLPEGTTPSTGP
ncbi:MAG: hypothetical protein AAGF11_09810 [Myxococcota bacterium]